VIAYEAVSIPPVGGSSAAPSWRRRGRSRPLDRLVPIIHDVVPLADTAAAFAPGRRTAGTTIIGAIDDE
jgi:hypothetical protein